MCLSKTLELAIQSFKGVLIAGPRTGSKTPNMHIPKQLPPIILGIKGTVSSVESLRPNAFINIEKGGKFKCWMENLVECSHVIERCDGGRPAIIGQANRQYLAGWPDQEALIRILSDVCIAQNISITNLPNSVRVRDTESHRFWFNYSETESIVGKVKLAPSGVVWESL
jgi:beta-galactosidase